MSLATTLELEMGVLVGFGVDVGFGVGVSFGFGVGVSFGFGIEVVFGLSFGVCVSFGGSSISFRESSVISIVWLFFVHPFL